MSHAFDAAALAGLNLVQDDKTGRYRIAIPERCNIASDTVGRHAAGPAAERTALIFEDSDGTITRWSYRALDRAAAALAAGLVRLGVGRGDRVAVHLGQRPEAAHAHLAVYRLGAIVVTVSQLYGPETIAHILADSGAAVLLTEDAVWAPIRDAVGRPAHVAVVGTPGPEDLPFQSLLDPIGAAPPPPADTGPEDPALLIYSSGSTGPPKGILHGHRALWAYNLSTTLFYNLEMARDGLVFWTPADWAWVGGWNDTVLPAWFWGQAMVASQHRFEAEWAFGFMARHGVTHSFMTPTALKRLAQIDDPRADWPDLALRTVWTGGESLPGETLRRLTEDFGLVCNEGYGLTEVNHMIGNCAALRPAKPGSMGFELPGHRALLVDDDGLEVPDGEPGEIVTTEECATLFLGYWNRPDLTAEMRLGPYVRTRDLAVRDADGYFFYRGRTDDLIKSAGFRIGPAEIEDCLLAHAAVADCGVVGVPDAERGQVVKAFVLPVRVPEDPDAVAEALRAHVRARLGGYKVPRRIAFVDSLPVTSTGKVSRKALRALNSDPP